MAKNSCKQILRRPKAYISPFATVSVHLRNPLITAWWSAAFPGFGHIILENYTRGFLLVIWEIIINLNSRLNEAIVYSFTGNFELAKAVTNTNWVILYSAVYIYAIWDSYRLTVDLNNYSILADHEANPFAPYSLTSLGLSFLDKRNPWLAAVWSMLTPGLGQLYNYRIITGFFVFVWWIVISYFSHLLQGIHFTALGDFSRAIAILDGKWLMFMPSIYVFSIYDAYVHAVEQNNLFEKEQAGFLKTNYQNAKFIMPLK